MRARGFTLIELLIVIVIIGILAAIAVPKFSNTKERALLATMKSDLRNLATAEESYFYENTTYYGGAIPAAGFPLQPLAGRDRDGVRREHRGLGGDDHPLGRARQDVRRLLRSRCAGGAGRHGRSTRSYLRTAPRTPL